MSQHHSIFKSFRQVLHPLYRRSALRRLGAFNLGAGRARRTGRALVSYVSDFVRFVTAQRCRSIWDRDDVERAIDLDCTGTFATHSQHWESAAIVAELIHRGFIVDCIYDRGGYLIEDPSPYDFILDEWDSMKRWAALNSRARKLFHGTTSHWLFWNRAELQRIDWLFKRRGVCPPPERQVPAMGLEDSDLITFLGNSDSKLQFGPQQHKLRRLWITPPFLGDPPTMKNWSAAKRRFLWFGSSSWVHRGLDLVVEAFLQLPDLELFICGSDRRFLTVYGEDLYKGGNIHHVGFVTPASEQFQGLVSKTVGVVYASAAEGCSTSMVQCMHFGLIPIVTEATGLSVHDYWPALRGDTDLQLIADIRSRCMALCETPDHELEDLSRWFRQFARQNHSRESFRTSLNTVFDELLGPSERAT